MATARTIGALVDQIRDRRDELDATADAADRLGRAPVELDRLMRELRVPMVKVPLEVGGDQLGLADQFRYFEALSHANATAGWTGFNHAGAAGMAGASLGEVGLEAVFGSNPSPIMAAVAAPSGTFERVDGGVRASGTWRYASGIRHADWVMLTALAGSGARGVRMVVVPVDAATVTDDWDVMALKGTGSMTARLDDVFVADELVIDPTADRRRGGPLYRQPYQVYVAPENLGFTIGVCQRFLDELVTHAGAKARGSDGRLADRGAFQYELGKGQLQVNAARAYAQQCFSDADAACRANGGLTPAGQQHIGAMLAYCTESAANAVSHLFHFAGAGALFSSSVLQRCFRDAHGSVQHAVASNTAYDRFGQTMLAPGGAAG